ncbi:MAG: hypothetical protein U0W24_25770 [Bacteroidales bacterium]
MKGKLLSFLALGIFIFLLSMPILAQEETNNEESESPFTVTADIVSNYIWRGSKLSPGPSIQPTLDFTKGGFSIGAWGSADFASGYAEVDPYLTYAFPFGLALTINDYYNSDLDFSNFSDTLGSHAVELSAAFEIKGFSLGANYIVNEAGGIGSEGGDMYFEAGYTFKNFNVFAGAGNGWYTTDSEFKFCNIGLGATKELTITDKFKLPLFGQVIYNPDQKLFYLVFGLTL